MPVPMSTVTAAPAKVHANLARGMVKPGQVFANRNRRTGRLGASYAHIGTNGFMYSVNTTTGELSSSDNEGRAVELTGSFIYKINRNPAPSVVRECPRSEVRSGEVFHAVGKEVLYAHLGTIERSLNGFLSVPLSRTENHAVTRNGNGHVQVVATFMLDVTPKKK